jgi:hypothetical protein
MRESTNLAIEEVDVKTVVEQLEATNLKSEVPSDPGHFDGHYDGGHFDGHYDG